MADGPIRIPFATTLLAGTALAGALLSAAAFGVPDLTKPPKVDFAKEIQPLLKARCFQCHGDNLSQGGLRLDSRAALLKGGASGPALLPGNAAKSSLLARLDGHDGKPRMPLGFAPLTDAQIKLFRAWIDQGAAWPETSAKHWAFAKPFRPAIPTVKNSAWVRNPIDAFVLSRLEKEGLKPSPEADKTTLIRRVTLDLIGLPPTTAEMDAFLRDTSPNAYEKVVDRLLANPHYGERMALPWLDAARYADSNGFQQDGDTFQYVWRDWVVKALNDNMPFDQFTIEQLAGDLLPNATMEQKIATGFNRCHLLNGEGGAIPEEQRNVILFDRVDVTATTWLGATLACAQCHNHKYDPYTQKDYYSFMAFFNNVPESGVPSGGGQYRIAEPFVTVAGEDEKAKLKELETAVAEARGAAEKEAQSDRTRAAQTAWEADALKGSGPAPKLEPWSTIGPFPAASFDAAYETAFIAEPQVDLTKSYLDGKLKWAPAPPALKDGAVYQLAGENAAIYFHRIIRSETAATLPLSFGSDDGIRVWLNGKQVVGNKITRGALPDQEKVAVALQPGENHLLVKIVNGGGIGGIYFKAQEGGVPDDILPILKKPAAGRSEAEAKKLRDYFLANFAPAPLKEARERQAAKQKELDAFRGTLPRVMVMSDDRPRKTHLLIRGNYDMPGDEVGADTPSFLSSLPSDAPKNRLGLARWLVNGENPLTARVQVNRFWQTFFGKGLVKTPENFGTQAEPPTHPELLEWLAAEFSGIGAPTSAHAKAQRRKEGQEQITTETQRHRAVYTSLTETRRQEGKGAKKQTQAAARSFPPYQGGTEGGAVAAAVPAAAARTPEHLNTERRPWDVKALVRLIVTSSTYRQSSKITPVLRQKDPENKLLSRAARFRLPSLLLRDLALASSGLLNDKIGGKPVYPYQPKGIWDGLAITNERDFTYPQSKGADLFRRSLYTFWRRTVAPADMFDASTRTTCSVRQWVTSTPLHALTTLNDITWVEAGRALAERVMKEAGPEPDGRLAEAFRRVCARKPKPEELALLRRTLNRALAAYRADPKAAESLLKAGESPRDTKLDAAEHAAYATACQAIFNLDEALTRE